MYGLTMLLINPFTFKNNVTTQNLGMLYIYILTHTHTNLNSVTSATSCMCPFLFTGYLKTARSSIKHGETH